MLSPVNENKAFRKTREMARGKGIQDAVKYD